MKIAIGCDEAAYSLKKIIIDHLSNRDDIELKDFGAEAGEVVLYPDVAKVVAEAVASGEFERGILVCGTGIGMCITANKILESVQLSAMILSLQKDQEKATMHRSCVWVKRVIGPELAKYLVDIWLKCDFAGGGSTPKVNRINEIDAEYKK